MTTKTLIALITGGMSGIGCATATKLTQLSIHVIVGRNADRAGQFHPRRQTRRRRRTHGHLRMAGAARWVRLEPQGLIVDARGVMGP